MQRTVDVDDLGLLFSRVGSANASTVISVVGARSGKRVRRRSNFSDDPTTTHENLALTRSLALGKKLAGVVSLSLWKVVSSLMSRSSSGIP